MQTSEQAAAPAADSRSIQQRIGAWLSTPSDAPKPEPKQVAPAPEQAAEPATDQVPDTTEATSDEAPAESTAPPFEEVEFEGKTYQVPPELKEAFIRQSDYTKKSQSLAEQRRSMELLQQEQQLAKLHQEFQTSTQAEQQQLQALEYVLSQPVDWGSMSTDELLKAKVKLDGWREQKAALEKSIGEKRKEWEGKQSEAYTKLVRESLDVVGKRIPGWGPALAKQVTEHALSEGYTDHELRRANTDPRLAITLWKAQQYDSLKAKATAVPQTAKAVKTTATNPMPAQVKDQLNFRKQVARTEGKPAERRALVEQRIQNIFGKR